MGKIYIFTTQENKKYADCFNFLKSGSITKIVFSFALIFIFGLNRANAQGPGTSWEYKRAITLSPATPLANFQVQVILGAGQYAHMKADGSDLRFYDNTDAGCSYWIEKWNNTGNSVIWVNVPTLGATGLTMYYGNPVASAVSDGNSTFDFFDDFLGTTLAPNWLTNSAGGAIAVSGSQVTLNNTNGDIVSIYSPFTPGSASFIIEAKHSEGNYHRNRFYATDNADNTANNNNPLSSPGDYGYFSNSSGVATNAQVYWGGYYGATTLFSADKDYLTRWDITDGATYNWSNYDYASNAQLDAQSATTTKSIRYLTFKVTEQPGTSTSVDWARVRKAGTTVASAAGGEMTNLAAPVITGLSPTPGCEGSNITINGSGFTSAFGITVKIGGTPVSSITSNNGTTIIAVIGAGSTGQVTVATGAGTATSAGAFTVNLLPTINAGPGLSAICQGGTSALLGGTVGGGATGGTWSDGGVGGIFSPSSTTLNAQWTPPANYSGTATLTLTTTGSLCGNPSAVKTQVVNATPTGAVTVSATSICFGSPVTFTAPAGYSNYVWKINGASAFTSVTNTYAPSNLPVGNPVVTVDITSSSNCMATLTAPAVAVSAYPTGSLTISENSGIASNDNIICAGDPVNLSFDPGFANYNFKVNGTSIYSGADAFFSANALVNGQTITVDVTGAGGCIKPFGPQTITVRNLPTGSLIVTENSGTNDDNIICAGANVKFTAPGGNTNYDFYVSGVLKQSGAANIFNTTSLSDGDAITVIVTNANKCSETFGPETIVVKPLPAAPSVTADGPVEFCIGGNVTLTSSAATTYQWYKNGILIGGAVSQSYIATMSGAYKVAITNSNTCGAISAETIVTVDALPSAPVITAGGPTTFCAGGSVTLTSSTAATYQWNVNGSPIGGANNQNYVATTSGNYTVDITNSNGCGSISALKSVTVNPLPLDPTISANGPLTFCDGGNVQLTSSAASTYKWFKDGVLIAGATAQNYVASTSGSYTVSITNGNGCGAASAATLVTINPLPDPTLDGPNPICPGSTGTYTTEAGFSNYTWTFTGGTKIGGGSVTDNSITITWDQPGAKSVFINYQNAFGCSASESKTVNTSTNPLPTITGPQNICINYLGNVYTTQSGSGEHNYVWTITGGTIDAGGTSSDNTATVTWTSAGAQSISVNYNNITECTAVAPTKYNVTVKALPVATFSYVASPYCANGTDPSPTLDAGAQGGTWSSTAGLSINTSTGKVDVSASMPGTYTVTNTIAASGGCNIVTATSDITITQFPTAVISYAGTPFCTSDASDEPATLTGTAAYTGGTWSSTTGLSLDASTGAITPSTSTPGSYTVTYTIPGTAGCSPVPVSTTVNITALPTATITYGATPFCKSITSGQPVSLSGTGAYTGGTYSSTPGLMINSSTGVITPNTSTAGTYTVTYSTPSSNGCGAVTANTSVTITDVPTATISYTASPYCTTLTSVPVSLSGTGAYTGGTYASTAGLVINASGNINPSTSTPGTYTVTYTIPNSGGCAAVPVTTNVTITAAPTVSAGTDVATCAAGGPVNITLDATASNFSSVAWTSSGTGTWTDANSLTMAAYTPGTADKIAGSVTLTLTASGTGNCGTATAAKTLTINANPAPVVIKPTNPVFCLGGISSLTSVKDAVTDYTSVFNSVTDNVAIPDNNFTGVSNTIAVSGIPANAIINSITVKFDITHPHDIDLTGNLTAPNFNTLNLFNSLSGANYTNTIIASTASQPIQTFGIAPYSDGPYAPNAVVGALGMAFASSFNNLYSTSSSLNGNWVIRVADNGIGDIGTFNSWSVTIDYSVPVVAVPVTWFPYTDLFNDAAATVPYAGDTLSTVYTKPSTEGTKTYTATSSSAAGCTTATDVTVTVKPSPSVFILADYCSTPGSVTLTANAGTVSSYNWSNGATTQTTLVDLARTYFVSVTNSDGCVGTGSIGIAQELVVNGDFTQGNVGFTSGYTYYPDIAGNRELVDDSGTNGYGVGTEGQNYHPNFYGEDHSNNQTGQRNFMLVNGHGTIPIWEETVSVLPNTNYYYSAWAMNLYPYSSARLQFQVNGVNIGTIADLNVADKPTSDAGVSLNNWKRFYYGNTNGWNSGSNTTAVIRIVDLNSDLEGNDFGLDDISFATLSPFVTGPGVPGTNNQVVCTDEKIDSITYKVGSGASGPLVTGLPDGVIYTFDGLNLIISGTPTVPGTYKYTIATTGSCPDPKADSGVIVVNPKASITLSSPGKDIQSVCINANMDAITYSIGGGGTGAAFANLPAGISGSYFNGVATISGSPSVAGVFNYQVITTGTCKQDTLGGILTISAAPVGGTVTAPTICIGGNGTVTLSGYTGIIDHWETSSDGITYSTLANTTTSQDFTNATQAIFYRVAVMNGACNVPVYSSVGKVKISNLWEGKYSADWSFPLNWSSGNLPDNSCSGTATIPQVIGTNYDPVLSGTGTVTNLNVLANGHLTINGGNLQVAGSITNNGIVDATNGGVEYNGSAAQTIAPATFLNNAIKDLKISNTNTTGVSMAGPVDVYRSVTYGTSGKTLVTNDNLTLKSTATETAWLGNMTGHTITGNVTVERYIATGTGDAPNHGKSWQMLAVPTQGQSIKEAWQEGATATNISSPDPGSAGNPHPGYGTMLTSPLAGAASQPTPGFDAYTAPGASIKTYVSATNGYDNGPSSTANQLYNQKGYFILVRGDRGVTVFNQAATPTVLRSKGVLFTPANLPPVTNVAANKFESVGNPYASAIDMRTITKTGGVNEFFYVWDPRLGSGYNLGAFQTLNKIGNDYYASPGGGSYGSGPVNYIQSGQAFLVQTTSSSGTVSFSENAKANGSVLLTTPNPAGGRLSTLRTRLNVVNASGSTELLDGTLSQFDDKYSNAVDGMDARKSSNTGENLSIKTGGKLLAIERKHTITQQDTIFLNLSQVRVQKYQFHFEAENLDDGTGLEAFLEDSYLHTRTPVNLNGSTDVNFSIVNIAGSYASNRFRIVFAPAKALPVTFTSIKAYQQDKNIRVEWRVNNEVNIKQYEVEKSINGNQFNTIAVQPATANNGGAATYVLTDEHAVDGYNYYRVKSVDLDGKVQFTQVVKVLVGRTMQDIRIYPNPITDGTIHLQLENQPGGKYGIRLLNKLGQVIVQKQVSHAEGNSTELIKWDYNLAHGMYQLEVTKPDGSVKNLNVMY